MSSIGVFSDECSTFLDMMNDIDIDKERLIQNQQRLREIFKEPPLISYLLVSAKLWRSYYFQYDLVQGSCDACRLFLTT